MTDRDHEIIDTLTRRVRVLSIAQVAATWWPAAARSAELAKARLTVLQRRGLVELKPVLARPEPRLESPIVTWRPGAEDPEFGPISYKLRSRWHKPAGRVLTVIATDQAGNRYAGKGGRAPRASEATHDLCLAAVYLRLRATDPKRARRWISEGILYERGEGRGDRLPDAIIITRAAKMVVEFGGAYRPQKVADFHRFCSERGWGYELW